MITYLFPARAGVIPALKDRAGHESAIPRTRGGDPYVYAPVPVFDVYSPHARG